MSSLDHSPIGQGRGVDDMRALLRERVPDIMEKIRLVTQQPGVSLGVIHQGEVVIKHNIGVQDIVTRNETNSDTLYCISSLSKAFMAASLDLLVQEQKISWDTTIESVLPNFRHAQQPEVYSKLTARDICSHRSGLLSLDEITQGLDGRILLKKEDVVNVCSALPIKHDLRSNFLYNNALYELAGCLVEHTSGYSNWGDFQHDRIFKPLGMSRTTAFRSIHDTDDNIATPYMILTDGKPTKIAPTELSANSMNGGSGAVRSSVNDLLKWCMCLLQSFNSDEEAADNLVRKNSPIFNRTTMANPQSAADGGYCMGWCHHRTPAKLGLLSPDRSLESPVVGSESPSLLLYSHQGNVPGYTCNLYIIPEGNSAIVVLSNGTGLSDATDWIAQDLLQAMYGLRPAVNFIDVASKARLKYLSHYTDDFRVPLEENRILGTQCPPLEDFVGTYIMDTLDLVTLDFHVHTEDPSKLRMMVNQQHDQTWELWHYHFDVFCHLPDSYDSCLSRGLDRTHWSSFLTSFIRGQDGRVERLYWELDGVAVHFYRT
ncbi:hypothetical protein SLS62_006853 [Diatrype stigma]|uniref:Beta-lactamase-related domain-containing protein n=1 Tax=Diatrype stigma TaxID=117547 RepID=A0AAN9UXQ4_9PEZI